MFTTLVKGYLKVTFHLKKGHARLTTIRYRRFSSFKLFFVYKHVQVFLLFQRRMVEIKIIIESRLYCIDIFDDDCSKK